MKKGRIENTTLKAYIKASGKNHGFQIDEDRELAGEGEIVVTFTTPNGKKVNTWFKPDLSKIGNREILLREFYIFGEDGSRVDLGAAVVRQLAGVFLEECDVDVVTIAATRVSGANPGRTITAVFRRREP